MKERKEKPYIDDGRTIADMNVKGMPWHIPGENKWKDSANEKLIVTKAERKAIFWGTFSALLPLVGLMCLGFFLIYLALYLFWLN